MSVGNSWTLQHDFSAVGVGVGSHWEDLHNARIFITGGTGFIGRWMLETLRQADEIHGLNTRAVILTRDPTNFSQKTPHLAAWKNFTCTSGDVSNFQHPEGQFSHVIHAATDARADLNEGNPCQMFDTVLNGTRQVLDFAVEKKVRRFLYLSSGAVYGQQASDLTHINEDCHVGPDCTNAVNAYAEGKRAAEMLCAIFGKQFGLAVSTARIFAILGPLLALDIHFAAGNFIRDAIEDRCIVVKGNGRPVRSYLYITDLVTMLWHLLLRGRPGRVYNLGSEEGVSIGDLAKRVAELVGRRGFEILEQPDKGWNTGRYVPSMRRAGDELGLFRTVSLDEAIRRTAIWNGWKEHP